MRIVCWNCRRANRGSGVWNHLGELDPDIALLQEVTSWPEALSARYRILARKARGRAGLPQRFHTLIMAKAPALEAVRFQGRREWVTRELEHHDGNLVAAALPLATGERLTVVSVHSPAWPVARTRVAAEDTSGVQLTQNRDVWVADLLYAAMAHHRAGAGNWVIGGDFNNTCETFDLWRGGPRGHREYLDRMADSGFLECLRHSQGGLTPTYRKPGSSAPKGQLDHCFASTRIAQRLCSCSTSAPELVFGTELSDHLPIIADFAMGRGT